MPAPVASSPLYSTSGDLSRCDDLNQMVRHMSTPMNAHMTNDLTRPARRPLTDGYDLVARKGYRQGAVPIVIFRTRQSGRHLVATIERDPLVALYDVLQRAVSAPKVETVERRAESLSGSPATDIPRSRYARSLHHFAHILGQITVILQFAMVVAPSVSCRPHRGSLRI